MKILIRDGQVIAAIVGDHSLGEGEVLVDAPEDFDPLTLHKCSYANGVLHVPTAQELVIADFSAAIQARLDAFAQTRNYDGILSACTYATSTVTKFHAEGQYCVDARDATWNSCYSLLASVEAGTVPMPTLEQVIAQLPALAWPA